MIVGIMHPSAECVAVQEAETRTLIHYCSTQRLPLSPFKFLSVLVRVEARRRNKRGSSRFPGITDDCKDARMATHHSVPDEDVLLSIFQQEQEE